jgi:hypothetical protein
VICLSWMRDSRTARTPGARRLIPSRMITSP